MIGIGALLFIAADAGVWAWLVLGLGLILASVIVVRAMARRNRRPALAAVPPPVAVAPLDGRFRLLVIADDSCTSAAFRDNSATAWWSEACSSGGRSSWPWPAADRRSPPWSWRSRWSG